MGTLSKCLAVARVTCRFTSGRDLDGKRRTNATFMQRAGGPKAVLTPHGKASKWAHKRHAERAMWRMLALCSAAGFAYGYLADRVVTLQASAVALCVAVGVSFWRSTVALRRIRHDRRIVKPLYQTLAPIAGHAPTDHHARYLKIPPDVLTNPKAQARLTLSQTWQGTLTEQKAIGDLVARRLGGDWEARFYTHKYPPYATFNRKPEPPGKLTYAQFRPYMERGSDTELLLGMGASDSVISFSLDNESPHFALSINTGGGKSALMRMIIAYLKRHGVERIDIIDFKEVSQNWAKNIPGIYIWRTAAAAMEAIANVRKVMEERYRLINDDETLTFPRHVLIIEEQNTAIDQLNEYWDDYRRELSPAERGQTPKKNPAMRDLAYILRMGREGCVNVFSVLQRMSAAASGGGDLRELYGAVLLGRWKPQTWKMLVGTTPALKPSRIQGRAVFTLGDTISAVQLAFLTNDEAREYAMLGATSSIPVNMPSEDEQLYSLRELASNVVDIRYAALRRAKARAHDFPNGVKRNGVTLYRAAEVSLWLSNRVRAA